MTAKLPPRFDEKHTPNAALVNEIMKLLPLALEADAPIPSGLSGVQKEALEQVRAHMTDSVRDGINFAGGYATALFSAGLITEADYLSSAGLAAQVMSNPNAFVPAVEKKNDAVASQDASQQPPSDDGAR